MLRRFIAALAFALLSIHAWADFGPIRVYSRLGEPLRAEVPLTDTDTMNGSHWRVSLADRATFDDLNYVYGPELADLRFSLFAGANGPVVLIRSQKPIRTPYLQFVLQLKSDGGRWVQGFDVRLESRGESDVIDVPADTAVPAAAASRNARAAKPAETGLLVGKHDTLASLADKIRPANIPQSQAMAALYLSNRAKFVAGDPPRPKPGARLAVPSVATMRAISMSHAEALLHPPRPGAVPPLAPLTASTPSAAPTAKPVAPPESASQPKPAAAPQAASQAAAYAASEAAARAKIDALQQQVNARAQDLQKADQHINDLNRQIKSLQASEAAVAKMVANGINYRSPKVMALTGGVALIIAVLFFLLGRHRRNGDGNGKKKPPKGNGKKGGLATTGVAQPDPSALEADGKGDPLAEAEVYLAYGHDDQAEDILRKALELHPGRQDIRAKLLEIYAARPDTLKFEVLAREVHDAYDGRGAQWERARAMGASIDPDNPLYRPEGAEAAPAAPMMDFSALETPVLEPADGGLDFSMPETASAAPGPAAENSLLDFDFSLEGKDAAPGADLSQTEPDLSVLDLPAEPARDAAPAAADLAWPDQPGETAPAPAAAAPLPEAELEAAFGEPEAAFAEPAAEPEPEPAPAPGDVTVEAVTVPPSKEDEALATKLDLAQVYLDMGDSEGAREVLHELIGEAKGTLKQRAEEMLADMAA